MPNSADIEQRKTKKILGGYFHTRVGMHHVLRHSIPRMVWVYEVEDRAIEPYVHDHIQIVVAKCAQVELRRSLSQPTSSYDNQSFRSQ